MNVKKLMYISPNLSSAKYGGSLVSIANLEALKLIECLSVLDFSINRTPTPVSTPVHTTRSRLGTAIANIFLLCGTLSGKGLIQLLHTFLKQKPDIVWLDSSIFGILIPMFRLLRPRVKIVCYFHNIECELSKERIGKSRLYILSFFATSLNEYLSAKLANVVVSINVSDSEKIYKKYHRKCQDIIPVTIGDDNEPAVDAIALDGFRNYILFVGSDFPPNIEALEFMSKELRAKIEKSIEIVAVGSGLDKYKDLYNNLKIHGRVESLAPYYNSALCVIAPIFSGGGMKVKIAEALKYGKPVLSSAFGAIGYEQAMYKGVFVADKVEDYAEFINKEKYLHCKKQTICEIFKSNYSSAVLNKKIYQVVHSLLQN
ncbi:glycosyltransferase [Chromobacterium haemolyticum]|uniref:glycosyltransferase n=1 Tax=Chromobacterium haemolyticum TaxID=394935 RepID=UPI000DEF318A|nr:glycosyltransferase [Chromobacterium haemolyticum]